MRFRNLIVFSLFMLSTGLLFSACTKSGSRNESKSDTKADAGQTPADKALGSDKPTPNNESIPGKVQPGEMDLFTSIPAKQITVLQLAELEKKSLDIKTGLHQEQNLKIRVLDKGVLDYIDVKKPVALMRSGMHTTDKALNSLVDAGVGIYCQTEGSETVQKDSILKLNVALTKTEPLPNDKTISVVTSVFEGTKNETLKLICTTRGKISPTQFQNNFFQVLHFSDLQGIFGPVNDKPLIDPLEVRRKRESFRILDVDTFMKTVSQDEIAVEYAIVSGGKLMDAFLAQNDFREGKLEQLCQIGDVKGTPTKDLIYRLESFGLVDRDLINFHALVGYKYKASENETINLICLSGTSTLAEELFNVYQGILEFGVATPTP